MAVFISVTTNAVGTLRTEGNVLERANIRRPLRGIQVKDDTYAVLRVVGPDGNDLPIFDSSSSTVQDGIGRSAYYSNFLIQTIEDQRMEKQNVVETFGEDFIFFFGERPRFLNVSGVLLNTKDFNWLNEWLENYDRYLRGTRMVEMNARLYLYFDDIVVEGYLIASSVNREAATRWMVPFQFQLFVCGYAVLSQVGSVFFQQNAQTQEPALPEGDAAKEAAIQKTVGGSGGSLSTFLTQASQWMGDASLSVQRTLETIKNTFYGRQIVVPTGYAAAMPKNTILGQAQLDPAPTNRPIHEMNDEYVMREDVKPQYDEEELKRVKQEMELNSPEQLEQRARALLAKYGIEVTRREATYTLLGRAAFATLQQIAPFGIRQVDGVIQPV